MSYKDIGYMTIPELIDAGRAVLDELQLRFMEEAGETPRMICKTTGLLCCWCRPVCTDRQPEKE